MQLDKPVLYLGSSLSRDDYENQELNEIYLFTNLDFVDIYRNDMLLGRYRPNKKKYPFLKYPPVILTDLIGDLLSSIIVIIFLEMLFSLFFVLILSN